MEDVMYEVAEDVVNEHVLPHSAVNRLMHRIITIIYEYRTEEELIKMAIGKPLKGIRFAIDVFTINSIGIYGTINTILGAAETLIDVAYKVLLAAYVSLVKKGADRDKDLMLGIIYKMLRSEYTESEIDSIVEKCRNEELYGLVNCILNS